VTREPGGGAHLVLGPSIPLRKPSIQLTARKKEHPLLLVLNAWSSPLLAAEPEAEHQAARTETCLHGICR